MWCGRIMYNMHTISRHFSLICQYRIWQFFLFYHSRDLFGNGKSKFRPHIYFTLYSYASAMQFHQVFDKCQPNAIPHRIVLINLKETVKNLCVMFFLYSYSIVFDNKDNFFLFFLNT